MKKILAKFERIKKKVFISKQISKKNKRLICADDKEDSKDYFIFLYTSYQAVKFLRANVVYILYRITKLKYLEPLIQSRKQ